MIVLPCHKRGGPTFFYLMVTTITSLMEEGARCDNKPLFPIRHFSSNRHSPIVPTIDTSPVALLASCAPPSNSLIHPISLVQAFSTTSTAIHYFTHLVVSLGSALLHTTGSTQHMTTSLTRDSLRTWFST
jgi:hypothetical protein